MTRTLVNGGAAAVCALVLAVSACASPPDSATPDATPTASAPPTGGVDAGDDVGDDAELFRAAEDTYRAYVDALNRVDLSDPSTFEPVYAWLSGDALHSATRSFSRMREQRLRVAGESRIAAITGRVAGRSQVQIDVCLDVSEVNLTNEAGVSVVSPERNDKQPIHITLVRGSTSTGLIVDSSEAVRSKVCG